MSPTPPLGFWSRIWPFQTHRRMESEVQEELGFHLFMLERESLADGLPEDEARRKAEERFGDPDRHRRRALKTRGAQMRKRRRSSSMDDLVNDLKYAFRSLLKSRGFTATVVLTLAVGIGATVAMYSVMDAALRQALPFPEPDRLVRGLSVINGHENLVSFPDYLDFEAQNESFEALGAMTGFTIPVTVTGAEEPQRVPMVFATGSLFRALGVQPQLGRIFTAEESAPGAAPTLLVSHGFWQRAFGGSPDVIGRTVNLNGTPAPIVGVMPADFHLSYDAEAWIPAADGGSMTGIRRYHNWAMVGRLKDGVDLSTAQAEMELIARQLEEAYPEADEGKGVLFKPLHEALVEDYRPSLFILMGSILLVLLIGCGNVANLLMARGSARVTEMAVRTALGANRGRLVRQLFTESVLLAVVAGALGILGAVWLQDLILGYVELDLLGIQDVGISPSLLGFTLLLSVGTALVFGTFPALAAARAQPAQDLKEGIRGGQTGGGKVRSGLVVLQVAVSVVLLIGAGLLVKSFAQVRGVDPGFDPEGLLAAEISLPPSAYRDSDERAGFFLDLEESVRALPGVESVGFTDRLPIRNGGNNVMVWAPERPPSTSSDGDYAFQRIISLDYFETMGIPLLSGRDFDASDTPESTPVIVLNQTAADTVYPGQSPLGRQVAVDLGGDEPVLSEVVGVVADQRLSSLRYPAQLAMYFPYDQRRAYTMEMVIRTAGDPLSLIRPVQERLWAQDREIPLSDPQAMTESLSASVSGSRAMATVLAMFSGVALFLAALGLYGVMAYFVSRRVREIGIRMAMGASGDRVARLILRRGMVLVALGLVVGFVVAFGAAGLVEDFLFETSTRDPFTFAGVGVFFTLVALVSCLVPAWRALRVDPVVAFKAE